MDTEDVPLSDPPVDDAEIENIAKTATYWSLWVDRQGQELGLEKDEFAKQMLKVLEFSTLQEWEADSSIEKYRILNFGDPNILEPIKKPEEKPAATTDVEMPAGDAGEVAMPAEEDREAAEAAAAQEPKKPYFIRDKFHKIFHRKFNLRYFRGNLEPTWEAMPEGCGRINYMIPLHRSRPPGAAGWPRYISILDDVVALHRSLVSFFVDYDGKFGDKWQQAHAPPPSTFPSVFGPESEAPAGTDGGAQEGDINPSNSTQTIVVSKGFDAPIIDPSTCFGFVIHWGIMRGLMVELWCKSPPMPSYLQMVKQKVLQCEGMWLRFVPFGAAKASNATMRQAKRKYAEEQAKSRELEASSNLISSTGQALGAGVSLRSQPLEYDALEAEYRDRRKRLRQEQLEQIAAQVPNELPYHMQRGAIRTGMEGGRGPRPRLQHGWDPEFDAPSQPGGPQQWGGPRRNAPRPGGPQWGPGPSFHGPPPRQGWGPQPGFHRGGRGQPPSPNDFNFFAEPEGVSLRTGRPAVGPGGGVRLSTTGSSGGSISLSTGGHLQDFGPRPEVDPKELRFTVENVASDDTAPFAINLPSHLNYDPVQTLLAAVERANIKP